VDGDISFPRGSQDRRAEFGRKLSATMSDDTTAPSTQYIVEALKWTLKATGKLRSPGQDAQHVVLIVVIPW
jgi:hypothetical protein